MTEPRDPVRDRYQSMLEAFDATMGGATRRSAVSLIQKLPSLLPEGEHLLAFVQARMLKPWPPKKVILAATSSRLIAYQDNYSARPIFESPRDDVEALDYMLGGLKLFVPPDRLPQFAEALPIPQADRIFTLLGGEHPLKDRLDLLRDGQPEDPGYPPIAAIWRLALYEDRLIDEHGRHLPFWGGEVIASCDSAGTIAATRGRNLAAKGVGTLFLGPIGLFGMGNAKEQVIDTRELYLLVEGPGWAYTQAFSPDAGGPVRAFAQAINLAAREYAGSQGDSTWTKAPTYGETDPAERLRALAALHQDGIVSDEEFEQHKARLLDSL